MKPHSSARAAHVIPFVHWFRDLGAPVDQELSKARLPCLIEELPEVRISNQFAHEFLANCADRFDIQDLAWRGARNFETTQLAVELRQALTGLATTKQRLEAFCALAHIEDSSFRGGVTLEEGGLRIFASHTDWHLLRNYEYSECLLIAAMIAIVRDIAGLQWEPEEISFESRVVLCDAAIETFPGVRLKVGAPHTSILLSGAPLATTGPPTPRSGRNLASPDGADCIVRWLREMISPYVLGSTPTLALAAELTGVSPRSLQRHLAAEGYTFKAVLDGARFQAAADLLDDPDNKIIDVALALGYESPQHFSRSFRRICGLSPREFRKNRNAA